MNRIILSFSLGIIPAILFAQPNSSFSLDKGTICLEEDLLITNSSTNATSYQWDFCLEDYQGSYTDRMLVDNLAGFSYGLGVSETTEGWHGFATARFGQPIKLTYGSSPLNSPTTEAISDPNSWLTRAKSPSIIETSGGDLHVFFGYESNADDVIRLDYGNSFTNTPTMHNYNGFGFITSGAVRDITAIEENGDLLLVYNFSDGSVISANYENSYDNVVDVNGSNFVKTSITGSLNPVGLELIDIGGVWYGVLLDLDGEFHVIKYGSSLLNVPTLENSFSGYSSASVSNLFIQQIGGTYYMIISNENESISLVDLGDIVSGTTPVSLDNTEYPSMRDVFSFKYEGGLYIQGIDNTSTDLMELKYDSPCGASVEYSEDLTPAGISYTNSGDHEIELRVYDSEGDLDVSVGSVTVLNNESPTFNLSSDVNYCLATSQVFTLTDVSTSGNEVSSYQWDFDGDGNVDLTQNTGDSDFGQATVDYSTYGEGTYNVGILGENTATCENQITREVTKYNVPSDPTDIEYTGVSCSQAELSFSYPGFSGLPSEAILSWNFDNEATIEGATPSYTFSTPGTKDVSLQILLSDCSTTIYTEQLTLLSGPEVSINYTNNCFGEDVEFESVITGNIISSYAWDFGDNTGTGMSSSETYMYGSAGDYDVELTATDENGCATESMITLQVNDQSLASITAGSSSINVPTSFDGIDNTLSGDEVTAWLWTFDDLYTSQEEDTTIVFESALTYEVSLEVMTTQGCTDSVGTLVTTVVPEFPTASFSLTSGVVCKGSELDIINNSANEISYEWDFCLEDYQGSYTDRMLVDNLAGFSYGLGVSETTEGWHGFATARFGQPIKLTFGSSPLNSPTTETISDSNSWLTRAKSPSIIETSSGDLHVFFGYESNADDVIRLDYGNSFTNTPTMHNYNGFGFITSGAVQDITAIEENGDLLLVYTFSDGSVITANYENSYDNVVDVNGSNFVKTSITGSLNPVGLELIDIGGVWYGVLLDLDGEFHVIKYGSSLLNVPTLENSFSGYSSASVSNLFIQQIGGTYYMIISNENESISLVDLGDIVSGTTPVSLDNTEYPSMRDVFSFKYEGGLYIQGIDNTSTDLMELKYDSPCGASVEYSEDLTPAGISYTNSGDHEIELRVYDSEGDLSIFMDFISVSDQDAPSADFSIDNVCIGSGITFTPSVSGLSYSWDFDGDEVNDSNDEGPTHNYSSTGTYLVRMDVSDGICTNFKIDTLSIYPSPPKPNFDINAEAFCIENELDIVNTTDETAYDDVLSYNWVITDLDTISAFEVDSSFSTSGQKIISVTSSLPGCESEAAIDTIFINPKPATEFSVQEHCFGEVTPFENLSAGNSDYRWSFGDGFSSASQSPVHDYGEPGTYLSSLTVTDENGCVDTVSQTLKIYDVPAPGFESPLICANDSTLFQDISSVDNDDIVSWEWYLDGELVSEERSPKLIFPAAGTFQVQQLVNTSGNCEFGITKSVEVLGIPDPQFEIISACVGETFTFMNSTNRDTFLESTWTVNDSTYQADTLNLNFDEPGEYLISLSLSNANLCSNSTTKAFTILESPNLDFEVFDACENDFTTFSDLSTFSDDAIIARTWKSNGVPIGNGQKALNTYQEPGIYEIELEVETASGCGFIISKSIEVFPSPNSVFEISSDYGLIGSTIQFENISEIDSLSWFLTGDTLGTSSELAYTFEQPGTYQISQIIADANGCQDTSFVDILIVEPEVDLKLVSLGLQTDQFNFGKFLAVVENNSNLPIEKLQFIVDLDNSLPLREEITERLEIGQSRLFTLNTSVPVDGSFIGNICVSVTSAYDENIENTFDNEECISLDQEIVLEPPFPNPAEDELNIKMILPDQDQITFTLLNLSGGILIQEKFENLESGLNAFILPLQDVEAGMYFLEIKTAGFTETSRIVVK